MIRFSKFFKLIAENNTSNMELYRKEFTDLTYKFIRQRLSEIALQIRNKEISLEEIMQKKDTYMEICENIPKDKTESDFLLAISYALNIENPKGTKCLIEALQKEGKLEDFNQYRILQIKCGEENRDEVSVFVKKGKMVGHSTTGSYETGFLESENSRVKMKVDTARNQGVSDLIDFTIKDLKKIQDTVKEILDKKEELKKKDPNMEMYVFDRAIMYRSTAKGTECYIIKDDELVKAEFRYSAPIKVKPEEIAPIEWNDEKEALPAIRKEKSISNTIFNMIKKVFKKKEEDVDLEGNENKDEKSAKDKDIRKQLRVESIQSNRLESKKLSNEEQKNKSNDERLIG